MDPLKNSDCQKQKEDSQPQGKPYGRREFLKGAARVAAMGGAGISLPPLDWDPVDDSQMEGLFSHLEQTLLDIRFLNPKQPKKLMMRLRRLFNRARPDQNEINILRGILKASQEASSKDEKA